MSKRITHAALLAVLILGASPCNTVKGLGEEIKSVGEAGERAID